MASALNGPPLARFLPNPAQAESSSSASASTASRSHLSRPPLSPSPSPSLKGKGKAVAVEHERPLADQSQGSGKKGSIETGVRFANMLERDRWMTGDGPRPRYRLKIRQHPERARLCSYKEENDTIDRRPIDPPIIVEVCTDESDPSELLEACNLFLRATIVQADSYAGSMTDYEVVKTPTGADATAGEVVQTPEKLRGLNGALGAYCIFAKVGARIPGVFRVKTTLYETSLNGVAEVASAVSEKFEVFSPKLFTGMLESTPLTRHFAAQGLKIKLRPQKQQTEARSRGKLATSAVKKAPSSRGRTPSAAAYGSTRGTSTLSALSSGERTPHSGRSPTQSATPAAPSGWASGWNSSWDRHSDREDGWPHQSQTQRSHGRRPTGDDGTFMPWDSLPLPPSEWKVSEPPPPPPVQNSNPLFYPPVSTSTHVSGSGNGNARAPSGGFPSLDLSRFSLGASSAALSAHTPQPPPGAGVRPGASRLDMDAILRQSPNNVHALPPFQPQPAFARHPASGAFSLSLSLQNRTSATRSEPRGSGASATDDLMARYRDDGLPTGFSGGAGTILQDTEMDEGEDRPVVPLKRPTKPSLSSLLSAE